MSLQKVLIIGAGKGGSALLYLINNLDFMQVFAIVDKDENAPGLQLAEELGIRTGHRWKPFLAEPVHIVFDVTGDPAVFAELMEHKPPGTMLVPGSVANLIVHLLNEKNHFIQQVQTEIHKQQLIFNSVEEGMIGINAQGMIDFINESACRMLGVQSKSVIGTAIGEIIPESKLVRVFNSGKVESNVELQLPNGLKIVSSRFPLFTSEGKKIGAFAVFKDVSEVLKLAEEITDLKQVKTMLEAIIHSSDDAISVVDNKGNGILVNPAYTRITGLSEDEVVGKPATVDINEGESIHMKVLKTKKPVRGVNMRIGESNRDVIVNVAPIIVDQHVMGSVGVIHDITEMRSLMRELDWARSIIRKLESTYSFSDINGSSPDIELAIEQAKVAAKSSVPVLLRGEPGTGKELFAHAIHSGSGRKVHNFIRVNCSVIDPAIIEKELFGEDQVNAGGRRAGLLAETGEGTLFLDEVSDLPPKTQKRLLDYIMTKAGQMHPDQKGQHARIITASSKNLEKAMHDGKFDEELYYHLNRLSIHIPPLRTRKGDIPEVANHLLGKLNQEFGMNVELITEEALERLAQYDWPGNVRELENVLSRAMIYMQPGTVTIKEEDIRKSLFSNETKVEEEVSLEKSTLASIMDDYERAVLEKALQENDGNKSLTASRLGISLRSLYYKLEKYKLI
ncbi:sigma 54-interacting transcriptional regulator [Sporosarcina sp. Te-1]|uniref:sigma 54-interacting transcriptional regulator n=1 Tax=Sporosarcina sp. Te-1 TaxID=2818390 RepID=UPI001FB0F557|nr:sigma 54-interacting transcriptional regulator [Sporosarcina sp. Te-1]